MLKFLENGLIEGRPWRRKDAGGLSKLDWFIQSSLVLTRNDGTSKKRSPNLVHPKRLTMLLVECIAHRTIQPVGPAIYDFGNQARATMTNRVRSPVSRHRKQLTMEHVKRWNGPSRSHSGKLSPDPGCELMGEGHYGRQDQQNNQIGDGGAEADQHAQPASGRKAGEKK